MIKANMVHGPSGPAVLSSPCMKNGYLVYHCQTSKDKDCETSAKVVDSRYLLLITGGWSPIPNCCEKYSIFIQMRSFAAQSTLVCSVSITKYINKGSNIAAFTATIAGSAAQHMAYQIRRCTSSLVAAWNFFVFVVLLGSWNCHKNIAIVTSEDVSMCRLLNTWIIESLTGWLMHTKRAPARIVRQ